MLKLISKKNLRILIIFLLLPFLKSSYSQDTNNINQSNKQNSASLDCGKLLDITILPADSLGEVYGFDPTLINGKIYNFFLPKSVKGNQYFSKVGFFDGAVTIKGVKYKNLKLNYDIYNQQLLLHYKNESGANTIISISQAWLDDFNLEYLYFKLIEDQKDFKRIYQVIGTSSIQIFYYWKTRLKIDNSRSHAFAFSTPEKECYVLIDNDLKKYKHNKSFILLFDLGEQAGVKKYLRENKINVKKASDIEMNELLTYLIDKKSE